MHFIIVTVLAAGAPLVEHAKGVNRLEVEVLGVEEWSGSIRATLYKGAEGFPGDSRKAVAAKRVDVKPGAKGFVLVFDGITAGEYAVSVHHDENGNQEFDTNWMGIPSEGWGASMDARGSFGPPSYDDAKFDHRGERTKLRITLEN
ncbi:MAG: DUF2141 domain-containing protein [Myxococcota bacterium]